MPNHNNETPRRKRSREERKKLVSRIVALIMAVLMVAGMAYYTIYLLAMSVSASDVVQTETVIDTSSLTDSGDVPVRVGLMYGDNITVGFEVTSPEGFTAGITTGMQGGSFTYTPVWDIENTRIAAATDGNLSKSNMTYSVSYGSGAIVGGYHVQVDCDKYSRSQFTSMYSDAVTIFAGYGLDVIPAYVYTGYTLRIGQFTSWSAAEEWVETVQKVYPGETVYVTGASARSVSVIDPETDEILFEYDCGGESELGLMAREDENGNTYMKTPAANVYDGVFVFSRYNNGTVDGVALTNFVSLEAYIAGVVPYEISNTWPLETLKAFALTVRSFTLTHLNRHSSLNFDLCNNAHCQVYKGAGRVNGNLFRAVTETAGQVITYEGDIVSAYYSSSVGGSTVSAKDAWGGDIPYLKGQSTPWEDYMNHENAFWIVEMSPQALAERLRQADYNVKGYVTDIRIVSLAENSTYVKVLEIVDSYGNTTRISGTDNVRTALTPNIKSANFVVGRGSVEYTENVVTYDSLPAVDRTDSTAAETDTGDEIPYTIAGFGNTAVSSVTQEYDKDYGYIELYDYHVITSAGEYVSDIDFAVTLMTGEGEKIYERQDIFVMSSESAGAFTGEEVVPDTEKTEEPKDTHVTETLGKSTETLLYKIAYADDQNNFIFVGKGWGHGVGMSQYGAYDLANMGYSAKEILDAYFDQIELVHYRSIEKYAD